MDPPYNYRSNRITQFPTMSESQLIELNVSIQKIVNHNSAICIWTTGPMMNLTCKLIKVKVILINHPGVWI